jgi:Fic family protein
MPLTKQRDTFNSNKNMELSFLLTQAQSLKVELDAFRPIDAEREARVLQKLRLDWNYHSNHLEGGKLTYGETKALILFGITAQGKPLQDHLEVSGHDEAILWIEEVVKKQVPITEVFIRQLHELILKAPYQKKAITPDNQEVTRWIEIGKYKSQPNHVKTKTGEIFRFASPEETPALMNDLLNWYSEKKEDKDINPILFASQFHYKFIRIHPFDDGNGRLARLLMNFILMQFGYPPAIIKTGDKDNYFAALEQADAGMLEPFISYIAENVIRSLEIMIKGAKGENIEEPDEIDKQVALLEQKLKGQGEKIEKVKSKETLQEWCKVVLPQLAEKFIAVNEKFKGFYLEREYQFSHYELETDDYEDDFDIIRKISNFKKSKPSEIAIMAKKSIRFFLYEGEGRSFKLICLHNIFNNTNIPDFDYVYTIRITFYKTTYNIIGEESGKRISKFYSQILTDEEIDYILSAEAQKHFEQIQIEMEKL